MPLPSGDYSGQRLWSFCFRMKRASGSAETVNDINVGKLKDSTRASEPGRSAAKNSASGMGPSRAELYQMGKSLRVKCPRSAHAAWKPAADRPDPIVLLEESNEGRIPQLIPVRYGRMMRTPFTWYRGAALNMAADLAHTPVTGLRVQACGDCHLLNFGSYATPERRVVFDINDLDETLPAPWEWDVKRLAASFVLACRNNGFREDVAREAVLTGVRSYREHMAEYSKMRTLEVWYDRIDLELAVRDYKRRGIAQTWAPKRLARAHGRGAYWNTITRA